MLIQHEQPIDCGEKGGVSDRRLHHRMNIMKRAQLFPVAQEVTFPINNMSHKGVAGEAGQTLTLRQCVHLSFNNHRYLEATVRWVEGLQAGLELKEPLLFAPGSEPLSTPSSAHMPRALRIPVDLKATLIVSGPRGAGTVRDISNGGMRIETAIDLPEGEPLLVQLIGCAAVLGRVQWSRKGRIGVKFKREVDLKTLLVEASK